MRGSSISSLSSQESPEEEEDDEEEDDVDEQVLWRLGGLEIMLEGVRGEGEDGIDWGGEAASRIEAIGFGVDVGSQYVKRRPDKYQFWTNVDALE